MRAIASYVTGLAILATIMFVGGAWTPAAEPGMTEVDIAPAHASFGLSAGFEHLLSATTSTVAALPPGCEIPLEGATCAVTMVAGGLDVPTEAPTVDTATTTTTTARPRSASVPAAPRQALVPRDVEAWRPLVTAYFGPGEVELALRVIYCESSGDPSAKNPRSSASGLFQHLARFWPERAVDAGWGGADIFDPEANVAVAAWLVYQGGGWSHWNPSRHCWG